MQPSKKGGMFMPDNENQRTSITLEELKQKLKENKINSDEFKNYWQQKQEKDKEFLSLLEWACELNKDDKYLKNLLRQAGLDRASDIMQELTNLGFALQKRLGEAFEKSGYRLLEQTRAGKRSDVMYGITRIFISNQSTLPKVLNEIFKPYYDDETFKCFMYAFLASVIKTEGRMKNEKISEGE